VLKEDKIEIYPKVSNLSRLVDSVEVEELPTDFLPALKGRLPLIGSGLHPSFEGQSRGSETPSH
jgi:hypothetical protein